MFGVGHLRLPTLFTNSQEENGPVNLVAPSIPSYPTPHIMIAFVTRSLTHVWLGKLQISQHLHTPPTPRVPPLVSHISCFPCASPACTVAFRDHIVPEKDALETPETTSPSSVLSSSSSSSRQKIGKSSIRYEDGLQSSALRNNRTASPTRGTLVMPQAKLSPPPVHSADDLPS